MYSIEFYHTSTLWTGEHNILRAEKLLLPLLNKLFNHEKLLLQSLNKLYNHEKLLLRSLIKLFSIEKLLVRTLNKCFKVLKHLLEPVPYNFSAENFLIDSTGKSLLASLVQLFCNSTKKGTAIAVPFSSLETFCLLYNDRFNVVSFQAICMQVINTCRK